MDPNKNFQAPSNPQSYAPGNPQKDVNAPPTYQEKKLAKDDFQGYSGQNPVTEGGLQTTQYETGFPLPSGEQKQENKQLFGRGNMNPEAFKGDQQTQTGI